MSLLVVPEQCTRRRACLGETRNPESFKLVCAAIVSSTFGGNAAPGPSVGVEQKRAVAYLLVPGIENPQGSEFCFLRLTEM